MPFLIFKNQIFVIQIIPTGCKKDALAVKLDDVVYLLCCKFFLPLFLSPLLHPIKLPLTPPIDLLTHALFVPLLDLEWLSALYGDVKRIHCEGRPLMRISLSPVRWKLFLPIKTQFHITWMRDDMASERSMPILCKINNLGNPKTMWNIKGKSKEKLQISCINLTPYKGATSLQEMKKRIMRKKKKKKKSNWQHMCYHFRVVVLN